MSEITLEQYYNALKNISESTKIVEQYNNLYNSQLKIDNAVKYFYNLGGTITEKKKNNFYISIPTKTKIIVYSVKSLYQQFQQKKSYHLICNNTYYDSLELIISILINKLSINGIL